MNKPRLGFQGGAYTGAGRLSGMLLLMALMMMTTGCLGTKTVSTVETPERTVARPIDLSRIPAPWKGPAGKLAQRGFSQKEIEAVFLSPNLQYTSKPMADKLKEIYPIFYRSERTKEVQQKLFQLGYDLVIDGRGGSGTKKAISLFQQDNKLKVDGEISDGLVTALNRAMKSKQKRSLADYRPPEAVKPSRTTTYQHFTSPDNLAKITAYYKEDKALFQAVGRRYQVPGEVAAAIMWVETRYGTFMGKHKAASNLASMAAAADNFALVENEVADLAARDSGSKAFLVDKAKERGDWALNELAALMRYSFDNGHDPTTFPGSVYGAIGWGQFMPSNISKFAVDGNGDGKVDLFNKEDAAFSIGNFIKNSGWKSGGMSEDERRAVIMKYNKSGVYVNTVLYLADHLAKQ